MINDVTVFNIREYLTSDDKILGEEQLQQVLSEFLCSMNTDVVTIKELQYMAGGMVVFLEAEDNEKLMHFYEDKNGFKRFSVRQVGFKDGNNHELIQLLKVL